MTDLVLKLTAENIGITCLWFVIIKPKMLIDQYLVKKYFIKVTKFTKNSRKCTKMFGFCSAENST